MYRSQTHLDLTVGKCVDGIGNEALQAKANRAWNSVGWMGDGYTEAGEFKKLPKYTTYFPLFHVHVLCRIIGKRYWGLPEPSSGN